MFAALAARAQPPTIQDVRVSQLVYVTDPSGPRTLSSIGTFEIFYTPVRNPFYANILATTGPSNPEVQWVVRNLFIADSSWIATPQRLSVRFDLGALGIQPGQPAEVIFFEVVLTPVPRFTAPPFSPTNARTGVFQRLNASFAHAAQFADAGFPYPAGTILFDAAGNVAISPTLPVHHIVGCAIPNLDLDSSARPAELNGCAPAAAANSLKWLDGLFDDITLPADLREVYNTLNALTNRRDGKPTTFQDFVRAKLDLIEMYDLPITVSFQGVGHANGARIRSSSGRTSATCENNGAAPDFGWMTGMLSNTCDVELWVNSADNSLGHIVTLSGWEKDTGTANGRKKIHYKHDYDQYNPDGTTETDEAVVETGGRMQIPDFFDLGVDGYIKGVVAECRKPGLHTQFRTGSTTYGAYSKSRKFVLPPRSKITFTYPTDPDRCFNSTLWVQQFPDTSPKEVKHSVWNFNSGRTRTYVNRADSPVVIRLKNDDNRFGRTGPDPGYTVGHTIEELPRGATRKKDTPGIAAAADDTTSPSNEEEYGGFSVGSNDSLHDEFTAITADSIALDASIGCDLAFAPDRFGSGGTRVYELRHPVPVWNTYWGALELRLTVDSVSAPGELMVRSTATGVRDTLRIDTPGVYMLELGGMAQAGTFDLVLRAAGGLSCTIDNIGVPSIIERPTTSAPMERPDGAELACRIEPNPTPGTARLHVQIAQRADVEITMIALDGSEVRHTLHRGVEAGAHTMALSIEDLPAGRYLCRIRAGELSTVLRLQVVR